MVFCFVALLMVQKPLAAKRNDYPHELSVCALFRDEARFLREWVEYHRLVGVDHFFLYNNLSSDDWREQLEPYLQRGIVEVIDWSQESAGVEDWNAIQCGAYNDAIARSARQTRWLAVIDTDEFIQPVKEKTLPAFLRHYEKFGGVGINWQMFGTSGVEELPPEALLLEQMVYKALENDGVNTHVKTIVRPRRTRCFVNPHYALFLPGWYQVDTKKRRMEGPFTQDVCLDKAVINHYWPRDGRYAREYKLARRQKWGHGVTLEELTTLFNEVEDRKIGRFVPRLRHRLALLQKASCPASSSSEAAVPLRS